MGELRWREKRDRDGRVIPRCWLSECGYTVAECRLPEQRFVVTRPGGAVPFAYCGTRDEVTAKILAAKAATEGDAR